MLKVGEGLWKSAVQGPTTFTIAVADPVAGQIGLILMMKADLGQAPVGVNITGAPPAPLPPGPADVQLALRLKVEKRRITEAEHIYARIMHRVRSPICRSRGGIFRHCSAGGSAARAT